MEYESKDVFMYKYFNTLLYLLYISYTFVSLYFVALSNLTSSSVSF